MRDFKAQFSEAAMRIPKGDALRPSELFEHLEDLKKSSQSNVKKENSQKEQDINRSYLDDAFSVDLVSGGLLKTC